MSLEVMTWAWKTQLKPTLKLTLLALSDYSNDEGICWPSIDAMVKKSSLTRSSLITNVQKLCGMGVIEKQKRYENGKRSSNEYRLKIELSPESIRMDFGRPKSIRTESIRMEKDRASPENGHTTYIQTIKEPSVICENERKNAKSANNYSSAFLEFYEIYPRKRDKKRAWQAWQKINPDENLIVQIMTGVKNLNKEIKIKNTLQEFIKYPAVWINGECWEDEFEISSNYNPWTKCKKCKKEMNKRPDSDYCYECENELNPISTKEISRKKLKQLKTLLPRVSHG